MRVILFVLRVASALAELFSTEPPPTPSCGFGCQCQRHGLVTRHPAYWIAVMGGKFQVVSDRGELIEEFEEHEDAIWLRDGLEAATRGECSPALCDRS
jgi:hypothetical protein